MYRLLAENSNPYLQNSIQVRYPTHYYNTRSRNQLSLPFPRVDAIKYNYQYQFVDIWNGVPENIKNSESLKLFRKRYTEYLINLY